MTPAEQGIAAAKQDANQTRELEQFLGHFPDDAKSWGQATDEIRDLARMTRMTYNETTLDVLEEDPKAIQALDFRAFGTPAQWNTEAKKQIRTLWPNIHPHHRNRILNTIRREAQ